MKKRLYIILASICLCSTIIAIIGILYLKEHKKTYSDAIETLSINNNTNEQIKNELEINGTGLNNDTIQSNNNSNYKNTISDSNINDNSKTAISIENNSKVTNKSTNSKTSTSTSAGVNAENKTDKHTTSSNSNGANISDKKQENQNNSQTTEQKTPEVQLNLAKYDRYEKALNGGYTCFKRNATEISKLRNLINQAIRDFGYTDVQVKEDSSIISNRYFTANKTNVENMVYDSEGFKIYYYAETEYGLTADGRETVFQVRSYIKVK